MLVKDLARKGRNVFSGDNIPRSRIMSLVDIFAKTDSFSLSFFAIFRNSLKKKKKEFLLFTFNLSSTHTCHSLYSRHYKILLVGQEIHIDFAITICIQRHADET